MTVKIKALTRYREKGGPGESLQQAEFITGIGMKGNFHQGGDKQLCLLTAEIREWMHSQKQKGLCFARFKENVLIEGVPGGILLPGTRLYIEGVVLQVSESRKRCHAECRHYKQGMRCRLSESAVFAAVERGGLIGVGDLVCVLV